MTGASVFAAGVLLQTEPNIDPNVVRPGWTPLLIIVLLLLVLVFLFFSMQKQMRKIRTPDDIAREEAEARAAENTSADTPINPQAQHPETHHPEKR
jgi:beta-lactam-binding protein with PASTA domain